MKDFIIFMVISVIIIIWGNSGSFKEEENPDDEIIEKNIERHRMLENIKKRKIKYYANCPGCGAPRKQGAEKCEFCGRSLLM